MIDVLSLAEARAWAASHAALLDDDENPFASAPWTLNFLDSVAARHHWRFLRAEAGRASLLLHEDAARPRQWRALTNYYASLHSPFIGAASTMAGAAALVPEFARSRPAPVSLELSPLAAHDAEAVQAALRAQGWVARQFDCFGNWYLPCEGLSFADYMARRPSQLQNTWKRKERKFRGSPSAGSGPGSPGRLELVQDPSQLEAALRAYTQVYTRSWKQPEPYPDFVPGWAAACAERGWLRLGIAWWHDEPVAAQFWFVYRQRAYIYKLAYDEAHAALSAGTVLSAHLFRHVLDVDHVKEVDYLTGDDDYKRAWVTHRRQRVGVIGCNPRTWQGAARAAREVAGMARERLVRRAPALAEPSGP